MEHQGFSPTWSCEARRENYEMGDAGSSSSPPLSSSTDSKLQPLVFSTSFASVIVEVSFNITITSGMTVPLYDNWRISTEAVCGDQRHRQDVDSRGKIC